MPYPAHDKQELRLRKIERQACGLKKIDRVTPLLYGSISQATCDFRWPKQFEVGNLDTLLYHYTKDNIFAKDTVAEETKIEEILQLLRKTDTVIFLELFQWKSATASARDYLSHKP